MKQRIRYMVMFVALAVPAAALAQHRDDGDRPPTGTAQPRSGSGEPEKAKPREPQDDGRARRSAPPAERRERDERPARNARRPDPGRVVFIGGYFYDPYFGPRPWWTREMYPHIAVPVFQPLARIRITRAPREAAVYVDGFYAGIVDEFDGIFQGLPLLPGGHAITLYLPGYRTVTRHIYLGPHASWTLKEPMAPLPPGTSSEPPRVAHMPPPPPEGTYLARPGPPAGRPLPDESIPLGTLSLRVQPATSRVIIDGAVWSTTTPGTLVVQLAPGRHRVDVETADGHSYAADVDIAAFDTTELNISVPGAAR